MSLKLRTAHVPSLRVLGAAAIANAQNALLRHYKDATLAIAHDLDNVGCTTPPWQICVGRGLQSHTHKSKAKKATHRKACDFPTVSIADGQIPPFRSGALARRSVFMGRRLLPRPFQPTVAEVLQGSCMVLHISHCCCDGLLRAHRHGVWHEVGSTRQGRQFVLGILQLHWQCIELLCTRCFKIRCLRV